MPNSGFQAVSRRGDESSTRYLQIQTIQQILIFFSRSRYFTCKDFEVIRLILIHYKF
ncbi:unnamed protein product [Brassica napus]|uniref:(rape) hypothetical protein n=1 Tax=Brassica napus TaxID=3708 RepID=A0A816IA43_BRANA|nr:unnamed protein product [Brassica napus]